jgi:hypothetical protein
MEGWILAIVISFWAGIGFGRILGYDLRDWRCYVGAAIWPLVLIIVILMVPFVDNSLKWLTKEKNT